MARHIGRLAAAAVVALVVLGLGDDRRGRTAAQTPSARSGLDLTAFDSSVRPQDDLFRYVNGGWIARTPMPPDRVSFGAFTELAERAERDLRVIIEDTLAGPRRPGSTNQQIADLYASIVDEAAIERRGAAPLQPELTRIDAIGTLRDFAAEAGYLSAIAGGGPFAGTFTVDTRDSSRVIVRIAQGGTLLPDRDYYLKDDPRLADIRKKYVEYLTLIFTLTGRPNAAGDAKAVLAIETELAKIQWSKTLSLNNAENYHPATLDQLAADMPGFDWRAWAKPQGIDLITGVSLTQPSFFAAFAALVPITPLPAWKAWLASRYITAMSPNVSHALSDARFEFFGRVLTGQELPRVRWKRGVSLVNSVLGDAVGRLYVEKHFSRSAKARVETLVANIIDAYRDAIQDADWLSRQTRSTALQKLAKLTTKVGYPSTWRDYRGLVIKPDDPLGNFQRWQKFDSEYRLTKTRTPEEHAEWLMTPQTVNAYYNPNLNEIILPAAILQPPLFDRDADDAVNYGAIGSIIGHEICHAFDGQGRGVDAAGAVRNWWTPQDEEAYDKRKRGLVAQFDAYSPQPGLHVNGMLTLAENTGDLSGLSMAIRAYTRSLHGRPSRVIDGFSGEQRVFLGWAQMWRSIVREEYERQWLVETPHALSQYRTNGAVSNVTEFYAAFGLTARDALFRPPDARIRIW